MMDVGTRVGYQLEAGNGPITAEALIGSPLVYLRAPNQAFQNFEKQAIVCFVRQEGHCSLLDEEARQKLAVVGINDVIEPFGIKLLGDTPRIVISRRQGWSNQQSRPGNPL